MDKMLELAIRCDGMLPTRVYQEVFNAGRRGGLIVEVGTALGASTTALALGLKESGLPGRVISFDPMDGGPRRDISTREGRVNRVRDNLRYFDVDHLVDLVTSDVPSGVQNIPNDKISVLMLDADGRIDRDLLELYARIEQDGILIIDDASDVVRLMPTGINSYRIDAKMRLTHLLLANLKKDGLVSEGFKIKNTYFGAKQRTDFGEINPVRMLEAYRELVFTRSRVAPLGIARRYAIRCLRALAPNFSDRVRDRYKRVVTKRAPKSAPTIPPV